jgi:hypothetical protein
MRNSMNKFVCSSACVRPSPPASAASPFRWIPWGAFQYDAAEKYVVLNIGKDLLENAPGFDKDKWPDMTNAEWANRIHSHYEHGSQGGRSDTLGHEQV